MIPRLPCPPQPLFQGHSGIIQPALAEKVHPAVRPRRPEQSWHGVDNQSNLVLRLLGHRDVHHGSDKLQSAQLISASMSHDMDVFDGTIWHQNPMFKIEVLPVLRRARNGLYHQGDILRMDT